MALLIEQPFYTSTGSYSLFISKISHVLSLNNFLPSLSSLEVFRWKNIFKLILLPTSPVILHLLSFLLSQASCPLCLWLYELKHCPGLICSIENLHYAWCLVWPLASLHHPVLPTGWHMSNLPRCICFHEPAETASFSSFSRATRTSLSHNQA